MSAWLDVTTILRWRRPATGVVRVEAELFRELSKQAGVRFCAFEQGAYVERAASEVRAQLERNALGDQAPPRDSMARQLVDRADALLRQAPTPVFNVLSRLKKATTPALRDTLHRVRQTSAALAASRAARAQRAEQPTQATGVPAHPFAEGDVLVSAGLDWDFKDLRALYRLKRSLGLRVVLVCYDLIPVLRPHLCRAEVAQAFPAYYADLAWVADHVLCISDSSQRDLRQWLKAVGAPQPPMSVIKLGSTLDAPSSSAPVGSLVDGPFVLFVSTLERRKNHDVLYRALVRLAEQGRALPKLVFVGMPGWGVDELLNDLDRDPRVRGAVVRLHHVTDAELNALYANARFTVFPSLYEGWGLPVAESLAHGRFCLVADTSSLREVGGELVEYLDPWDVEAWAERLAWWFDHPEEVKAREALIKQGFVPTPWSQTAKTVLDLVAPR
ncbi:MAG: glycosyltransferase family 1 protein [Myxococcaceae bacterium]